MKKEEFISLCEGYTLVRQNIRKGFMPKMMHRKLCKMKCFLAKNGTELQKSKFEMYITALEGIWED